MGEEDQELIAGATDLGLQVARQVAAAWFGEDSAKLAIQAPALSS